LKELLPDRYTSHRSTLKERGFFYFYNLLLLFIKNIRGAFNIRYATRYAALFIPSFNTHGEEKMEIPIL
jgi:hypothetical protein